MRVLPPSRPSGGRSNTARPASRKKNTSCAGRQPVVISEIVRERADDQQRAETPPAGSRPWLRLGIGPPPAAKHRVLRDQHHQQQPIERQRNRPGRQVEERKAKAASRQQHEQRRDRRARRAASQPPPTPAPPKLRLPARFPRRPLAIASRRKLLARHVARDENHAAIEAYAARFSARAIGGRQLPAGRSSCDDHAAGSWSFRLRARLPCDATSASPQ